MISLSSFICADARENKSKEIVLQYWSYQTAGGTIVTYRSWSYGVMESDVNAYSTAENHCRESTAVEQLAKRTRLRYRKLASKEGSLRGTAIQQGLVLAGSGQSIGKG